jgi:hypothetical protein
MASSPGSRPLHAAGSIFRVLVQRPLVCAAAALVLLAAGPAAAGAAEITGTTFKDLNRDGTHQAGEPVLADQQLYVFDAAGANLGTSYTGPDGRYAFTGLPDGTYRVSYAAPSWWALQKDWVPTTTGSQQPDITVQLAGFATADFGWRAIARSTDPAAPITSYTGPNGLRTASWNDVVSAHELYDVLMRGSLVGAEASHVVIRLDLASNSVTSASVADTDGVYTKYNAQSDISWSSWLDAGEETLFHEYGHAWSLYYAYLAQQDPTLAGYLEVRGLAGDTRVGSSYEWSPREMIAEDYRQLFGTATARSGDQMNRSIPPAAQVAGLADYLAGAFRTSTTAPAPTPAPPSSSLAVTGVAMSPTLVKTTGTAMFSLSASAKATVTILDGKGVVVRTLLRDAAVASGTTSKTWDRLDDAGRKVRRGTFTIKVDAVDVNGAKATAGASFKTS